MSLLDISTIIGSIINLTSSSGGTITIPGIQGTIGSQDYTFIRTIVGSFAGSGLAGAIFLHFREKLYLLPLRFRRNHTIVCGLNSYSLLVLRDLEGRNQKPVIIENDSQNNYLDSCKLEGMSVIIGDPADKKILTYAGVKKARYILAFSENDETNAEVALEIMQRLPCTTREKTTPIIQILDPRLYMLIRRQTFSLGKSSGFCVQFFNRYTLGAKLILDSYPPLYKEGSGSLPYPVIIFGGGNLGEMLTTRIARSWYDKKISAGQKPQIFLVDIHAEEICENLRRRYKRINDACDLVPIALDVSSAVSGKWTFLENPELMQGFTAYICFEDDAQGLFTATSLTHLENGRRIQIILRAEHNPHLARLISDEQKTRDGMLKIIPVDTNALTADSTLIQAGEQELIAQAIHEFYCINQQQRGETVLTNRLLVSWDTLGTLTLKKDGIDGKKFQESNRNQARMIRNKLNAIGCDIGPITDWDAPENFSFSSYEIEFLSELEHERWMQEKIAEGWHYGAKRDDRKKTHPSIIPYKDLSESEKEKDRDTVKLIPQIISLIDYQIYRFDTAPPLSVVPSISLPQSE
jgi:hypothetical protein